MRLPTLQALVDSLPRYGDRPALGLRREYGLRWWTYARLHAETYQAAALLRERRVGRGDRLLLWAPNLPEWAACLLGATMCGATVVPVDEGASADNVRRLAEAVGAVLLVHEPSLDAEGVGVPTVSIYARPEAPVPTDGKLRVPVDPSDPAVILYTSGTTRQSHGVILTHGNLAAQMARFQLFQILVRLLPTRMLMLSPLSHAQGLLMGLCLPLSVGLSTMYSYSVHPAHVIRTIKQNRALLLVAVPRLQHLLARALQDLPSGRPGLTLGDRARLARSFLVRRDLLFRGTRAVLGNQFWALLVGGANLPAEDERFWFDCGLFLAQGYGLTETAALVSFHLNTPFFPPRGSIGRPLRNQTVRLAEDGEILVRGPSVTPGYSAAGVPDDDVFVDTDGFLHTGDLAQTDARRRLYFRGRKKDVIATGEGYNVYPHEVESVLARMAGVRDAVVVGVTREGHEEVHAVLLLDGTASAADIVGRANAELAPQQRIRSWTVWPEADFPETPLLKAKRGQVAAAVAHLEVQPSVDLPEVPTLDRVLAAGDGMQRLRLLARYLTASQLNGELEANLRLVGDLGLSSLDVVELLSLLEIDYQTAEFAFGSPAVAEEATLGELHSLLDASQLAGKVPAARRTPHVRMDLWPVALLRRVLAPLVLPAWVSLCARLTVEGRENMAGLRPPFIIAGAHHEHGFDALAVYSALPPRLRHKLLLVAAPWVFRAYLEPSSSTSPVERIAAAVAFHVGMPLLLPYALWPHFGVTRAGFMETCRLVDRGYSPIVFPEERLSPDRYLQGGIGLLAAQVAVPIVPLRLEGNEGIGFRPRRRRAAITVRIGPPLWAEPGTTAEATMDRLRRAFDALQQGAGSCLGEQADDRSA